MVSQLLIFGLGHLDPVVRHKSSFFFEVGLWLN
jgi:hypothetical protein